MACTRPGGTVCARDSVSPCRSRMPSGEIAARKLAPWLIRLHTNVTPANRGASSTNAALMSRDTMASVIAPAISSSSTGTAPDRSVALTSRPIGSS